MIQVKWALHQLICQCYFSDKFGYKPISDAMLSLWANWLVTKFVTEIALTNVTYDLYCSMIISSHWHNRAVLMKQNCHVCIIDVGYSKLINHVPLILPFYKSCFILNKYLISLFSFQATLYLNLHPLLHMIQCSLNKSFCPFMEHVKASRSLFESIDTEGPFLLINLHPHKQPQRNNFHSSQFRAAIYPHKSNLGYMDLDFLDNVVRKEEKGLVGFCFD